MTINRIDHYIHASLAGAGFVILDSQIACTLRPDLWGANGGIEAAHEMTNARRRSKIAAIPGYRFLLRLQGHPRDAEVIARSDDMLDRRIQWATGMKVLDLFPMAELEGVTMVDEATTKPRAIRASDDLHHGTKTAEPGRTCSQCDRLSVNGMCMAPEDSQINRPAANVLRRCKAFTPLWGSDDGRSAAQLWPEIVGAK